MHGLINININNSITGNIINWEAAACPRLFSPLQPVWHIPEGQEGGGIHKNEGTRITGSLKLGKTPRLWNPTFKRGAVKEKPLTQTKLSCLPGCPSQAEVRSYSTPWDSLEMCELSRAFWGGGLQVPCPASQTAPPRKEPGREWPQELLVARREGTAAPGMDCTSSAPARAAHLSTTRVLLCCQPKEKSVTKLEVVWQLS